MTPNARDEIVVALGLLLIGFLVGSYIGRNLIPRCDVSVIDSAIEEAEKKAEGGTVIIPPGIYLQPRAPTAPPGFFSLPCMVHRDTITGGPYQSEYIDICQEVGIYETP
jgi:hypothetical protein